jgi:hypothetical protein
MIRRFPHPSNFGGGAQRRPRYVDGELSSSLRSGPNFYLFLDSQLRPILCLSKEEFAVLFIVCARRVPFTLAGVL